MAKKGKGIFLVYVDIDAKHDKEFNDWYNTEHLPELLAVPGILSAARYKAVKGGPKYLAFYELENVGVLGTSAFTGRPRTPWGQRVSPSVIGSNLTRIVAEQIFPDALEVPERGMLCDDFVRNYYRYADQMFACRQGQTKFPDIGALGFDFEIFASGEYSRKLEREWA